MSRGAQSRRGALRAPSLRAHGAGAAGAHGCALLPTPHVIEQGAQPCAPTARTAMPVVGRARAARPYAASAMPQ
jgi:hypothetical protein